jgi:hypothetical protein
MQSFRDFPDYAVLQSGKAGWLDTDGGAPKIYETLRDNPDSIKLDGENSVSFPIKCLENSEGYTEWSRVNTGAGGIPCDEYPNAAECSGGGGYTDAPENSYSDDSDSEQESDGVDCREIENPNLYSECSGGGYTDGTDNSYRDDSDSEQECEYDYGDAPAHRGGTDNTGPEYEYGNAPAHRGSGYTPSYIEKDFTRAEWAIVAGVDPEFITEDNASNLNERDMGYEEAVLAARRAAEANGWYDENGRRFESLTDLMREENAEVTGPGQNFQAADGKYIVTDGTASPYQSDGCYSDHDYRPPGYGELSDMSPGIIQGGSWNPDGYNCPEWMQGGEVFYEGDMFEVDWSKIEDMDTSVSGATGGGDSDSGDSDGSGSDSDGSDSSGLQVSADAATGDGFNWKKYCSENADDIGINAEDGISSSEAATCVEPCWGASASDATPHSENAQCGELVRDFCNPFFDYDSDTNTCEVG